MASQKDLTMYVYVCVCVCVCVLGCRMPSLSFSVNFDVSISYRSKAAVRKFNSFDWEKERRWAVRNKK